MRQISKAFPIVSFFVVVGNVLPAMAADVKLRERVVPKSAVVRLGDVADISSADRQEVRQLAAVPLMPAPAPETEQFLRRREVADMLAANGVDLGDIRFEGAEQVEIAGRDAVRLAAFNESAPNNTDTPINRHAAILAGAQVARAQLDNAQAEALKTQLCRIVGDYVKAKTGKAATGHIECNVTDRQLAQLAVATSSPVCTGGVEPWTGRQKFIITFPTANGPAQVPVYAEVAEAAAPMVVATRPVARGNVITAADVELKMIEPTSRATAQRPVLDSMEQVVGREARQPLQAGEVVYADQVQAPMLVKRGDLITVGSQGGGIRVRTSARALQDGANGDLIQVESLESKQRYDARVVGLREAAVFAATRLSTPQKQVPTHTARRPLTDGK
jgi:flagella basal body P-ring formation protein FlgA